MLRSGRYIFLPCTFYPVSGPDIPFNISVRSVFAGFEFFQLPTLSNVYRFNSEWVATAEVPNHVGARIGMSSDEDTFVRVYIAAHARTQNGAPKLYIWRFKLLEEIDFYHYNGEGIGMFRMTSNTPYFLGTGSTEEDALGSFHVVIISEHPLDISNANFSRVPATLDMSCFASKPQSTPAKNAPASPLLSRAQLAGPTRLNDPIAPESAFRAPVGFPSRAQAAPSATTSTQFSNSQNSFDSEASSPSSSTDRSFQAMRVDNTSQNAANHRRHSSHPQEEPELVLETNIPAQHAMSRGNGALMRDLGGSSPALSTSHRMQPAVTTQAPQYGQQNPVGKDASSPSSFTQELPSSFAGEQITPPTARRLIPQVPQLSASSPKSGNPPRIATPPSTPTQAPIHRMSGSFNAPQSPVQSSSRLSHLSSGTQSQEMAESFHQMDPFPGPPSVTHSFQSDDSHAIQFSMESDVSARERIQMQQSRVVGGGIDRELMKDHSVAPGGPKIPFNRDIRFSWNKATAGGNAKGGSWRLNQQWLLELSKPTNVSITLTQLGDLPPVSVGVYVLRATVSIPYRRIQIDDDEQRFTTFDDDPIYTLSLQLQAGRYVIIPCTESPGVEREAVMNFKMSDSSGVALNTLEDTWKCVSKSGEWNEQTSGGSWTEPTWLKNQQYALSFKRDAQVTVALSLENAAHSPVGFYVVHNKDPSFKTVLEVTPDTLLFPVQFRQRREIVKTIQGVAGETFNIIPSTFRPGGEPIRFTVKIFTNDGEAIEFDDVSKHVHQLSFDSRWMKNAPGGCLDHATWRYNSQVRVRFPWTGKMKIGVVLTQWPHLEPELEDTPAEHEPLDPSKEVCGVKGIPGLSTQYLRSARVELKKVERSKWNDTLNGGNQDADSSGSGEKDAKKSADPSVPDFNQLIRDSGGDSQDSESSHSTASTSSPPSTQSTKENPDGNASQGASQSGLSGQSNTAVASPSSKRAIPAIMNSTPSEQIITDDTEIFEPCGFYLHPCGENNTVKRILLERDDMFIAPCFGNARRVVGILEPNDFRAKISGEDGDGFVIITPFHVNQYVESNTNFQLRIIIQSDNSEKVAHKRVPTLFNITESPASFSFRGEWLDPYTSSITMAANEGKLPKEFQSQEGLRLARSVMRRICTREPNTPMVVLLLQRLNCLGEIAIYKVPKNFSWSSTTAKSPTEKRVEEVLAIMRKCTLVARSKVSRHRENVLKAIIAEPGEHFIVGLPEGNDSIGPVALIVHHWKQLEDMGAETIDDGTKAQKRMQVIGEILATETSYVKNLKVLVHHFMEYFESHATELGVSQEDVKKVFSNLPTLMRCNVAFWDSLRCTIDKGEFEIGRVFGDFCNHFRMYAEYTNRFDSNLRRLEDMKRNAPKFREMMLKLESHEDANRLQFRDFYITPVQRIPRYALLLEQLVKYTEKSNSDYQHLLNSLDRVKAVAFDINEKKRRADAASQVMTIQSVVFHKKTKEHPVIATPTRLFIRSDRARLCGIGPLNSHSKIPPVSNKKPKKSGSSTSTPAAAPPAVNATNISALDGALEADFFYLFNDMLLLTTERKANRKYYYKHMVPLNSDSDVSPLGPASIVLHTPLTATINVSYFLQFGSTETRDLWMTELSVLIQTHINNAAIKLAQRLGQNSRLIDSRMQVIMPS